MSLFALNDTQRAIRELSRDFARRRIAPAARENDAHGRSPADIVRELAGLGLMGVNIPAELGGAEAGVVSYALAMMEVASACASTAVTMAVTNMCAEVIAKFGSDAQQERYVPKLGSGEYAAGSFALSEPSAGSDPGSMSTTAEHTPNGW